MSEPLAMNDMEREILHKQLLEELKTHVREVITEVIPPAVKATVNGKIDHLTEISEEANKKATKAAEVAYFASAENVRMNKELSTDIKNINDLLEPWRDMRSAGKVMKWILLCFTMLFGALISYKTFITLFFKQ